MHLAAAQAYPSFVVEHDFSQNWELGEEEEEEEKGEGSGRMEGSFVMKSNGVTSQITMLADVTGEQSLSEMEPIFPH